MNKQYLQNRYEPGDVVYAKVNPNLRLVIRRYINQVYYCKIQKDPDQKEKVYFERELLESSEKANELTS